MSATGQALREELLPLLLHASAACWSTSRTIATACSVLLLLLQVSVLLAAVPLLQALRQTDHCGEQALLQTKALLQAKEPLQASAAAACGCCCCCCCCCCKHVHPCRHAPDLRHFDLIAAREDKEEGGRLSRCGGVACTASVEERRMDRTSACWCLVLLTLLQLTAVSCCLHDFCSFVLQMLPLLQACFFSKHKNPLFEAFYDRGSPQFF